MNRGHGLRRGGFTIIELLTVLTLIGILAGLGVPSLRSAVDRADATRVVTDMRAVRQALFTYREDSGGLPRTARWGTVPPELRPYIDGVQFTYKELEYRLRVNNGRGRVDLLVRYPRGSRIGAALQRFRRPGRDSGSVLWNSRQTRFRLLENNQ